MIYHVRTEMRQSLEPLSEPSFCGFVLRIISGPRVRIGRFLKCFIPPVLDAKDHSKAVDQMQFLICVALRILVQGISF